MARKRPIPAATRRAVAERCGATPYSTVHARCVYCGADGKVHWANRSWVSLTGLEFDHIIPEAMGGTELPENIQLACRRCNRSKGARVLEVVT